MKNSSQLAEAHDSNTYNLLRLFCKQHTIFLVNEFSHSQLEELLLHPSFVNSFLVDEFDLELLFQVLVRLVLELHQCIFDNEISSNGKEKIGWIDANKQRSEECKLFN